MLRSLLEDITRGRHGFARHPELIAALAAEHPHSIRALSASNDNLRYNCVMHALGVQDDSEYLSLAPKFMEGVHADLLFVEFLINGAYITERKFAAKGRIAVWLQAGKVQHAGRCISRTHIVSKWGLGGHVYEHKRWEVPRNYGDTLRFCSPLSRDRIVELFVQYAASRGFTFVLVEG